MPQGKISVITVSLNQGEFIRDNIESVLRQNYPNFEHIIIDGGSTDNTLEVLRAYPHLQWVSEKDRNQSHALNKGFSRATGDIIAWLNSDDWYADGTFSAVSQAMETYPLILTGADETDRTGKWKQTVPNIERSFHDLLRYWIPYAWLAQNGVFFTRSLLEEVKYGPGYYVDEDLHYCMDFDLWLRMAQRHEFSRRIDKVCGYFRIYDDNKTAQSPLSVQKEFGRVYRRHLHRLCRAERSLSFILPVGAINSQLTHTLDALMRQNVHGFDVIFADYCGTREESTALKQLMLTLEKNINIIGVRLIKSQVNHPLNAAQAGMQAACSPLVALVWPGDTPSSGFVSSALDTFSLDPVGLALPLKGMTEALSTLHNPQTHRMRFEALFSPLFIPLNFVARKEALEELGYFRTWESSAHALRELILRVLFKGWHVSIDNGIEVQPNMALYVAYRQELESRADFMSAKLVVDLNDEFSTNPFAAVRARHAWMPVLNPEVVQASRNYLSRSGK